VLLLLSFPLLFSPVRRFPLFGILPQTASWYETVVDPLNPDRRYQRVRWWSALALLRSLTSSPAAAIATLRSRAAVAESETVEEADEIGRHMVLDLVDAETVEGLDLVPGSDYEGDTSEQKARRRLLEMAREAEALMGASDEKLQKVLKLVASLLRDGFQPILFCRFIPTAEYVAQELRKALPASVQVAAVTGLLPPAEREQRIVDLGQAPQHVLVCTDCLSEGINLQAYFSAVVHYDLSWNPTRHEQREGRVDRYGQPEPTVRVVNYYGSDNPIDGIVLDVLLRKHRTIRNSLGISVPVPVDAEQVIEAVFEGLVLRENAGHGQMAQMALPGLDDLVYGERQKNELFAQWEAASLREKRSRTMFAQETIKVDEVAAELRAVQAAIGSGVDVEAFATTALKGYGATLARTTKGAYQCDISEVPRALRDAIGRPAREDARFAARFALPVRDGELYLSRTHPLIEGLATYVMDTALDAQAEQQGAIARRCGVVRTSRVTRRTTLLLVRLRYHILTQKGETAQALLAEECQVLAFEGSPRTAQWLTDSERIEQLLTAQPEANVNADQATHFLQGVLDELDLLKPYVEEVAHTRAKELLAAHQRVRAAAALRGVRQRVEPQFPLDMLGVYMYLPLAPTNRPS
jgi:Helicase conserved C-terminal domain